MPHALPDLDRPGATVLAVGAHADDIEIGAGGTLLRIRERHPGAHLRWLVCSAEGARHDEALAAAARFGADEVVVESFPDRFFPGAWEELKRTLARHCASIPDGSLVLAPSRQDRHQDHRVVGDIAWQVLRRQVLLAYEIPKWEGDLAAPNLYVPLEDATVEQKVRVLLESFPTQATRPWFSAELFRGLLAVRGVEAGHRWAEAFHAEKLVWD